MYSITRASINFTSHKCLQNPSDRNGKLLAQSRRVTSLSQSHRMNQWLESDPSEQSNCSSKHSKWFVSRGKKSKLSILEVPIAIKTNEKSHTVQEACPSLFIMNSSYWWIWTESSQTVRNTARERKLPLHRSVFPPALPPTQGKGKSKTDPSAYKEIIIFFPPVLY